MIDYFDGIPGARMRILLNYNTQYSAGNKGVVCKLNAEEKGKEDTFFYNITS